MRKFLIERHIPGVGLLSKEDLKKAARRSNAALRQLGTDIQWNQSNITLDKSFCIYLAKDESLIHEHAEISGFPANVVTEITGIFDPTAGEES